MNGIPKPLQLAHELVRRVVSVGDTVVDATVGNGHDTAFLAGLVGEEGKVVGFDIQQEACDSTWQRLVDGDLDGRCEIFCESHVRIADRVSSPVSAVLFNLGYLPGGDKTLTTEEHSTVEALTGACRVLAPHGLIAVMCYVGHAGGSDEACAVERWASELARESWRVFKYLAVNAPNDPPFLLVIERMR